METSSREIRWIAPFCISVVYLIFLWRLSPVSLVHFTLAPDLSLNDRAFPRTNAKNTTVLQSSLFGSVFCVCTLFLESRNIKTKWNCALNLTWEHNFICFHLIHVAISLIRYSFVTLLWTHLSLQLGGTCVTFEPGCMASLSTSPIARWLEHPTGTWKFMGSTPVGRTQNFFLSIWLESTISFVFIQSKSSFHLPRYCSWNVVALGTRGVSFASCGRRLLHKASVLCVCTFVLEGQKHCYSGDNCSKRARERTSYKIYSCTFISFQVPIPTLLGSLFPSLIFSVNVIKTFLFFHILQVFNPKELEMKVGDKVDVQYLGKDERTGRVEISRKALLPKPPQTPTKKVNGTPQNMSPEEFITTYLK